MRLCTSVLMEWRQARRHQVPVLAPAGVDEVRPALGRVQLGDRLEHTDPFRRGWVRGREYAARERAGLGDPLDDVMHG
jgi:hypothetical protein